MTAFPDTSPFAEGENSLIVFVTGIGQSFSYLFGDEYLSPDAFASGTLQDPENYGPLIAEGKFKDYWNIFPDDLADRIKNKETKKALLPVIGGAVKTLLLRKNSLKPDDARRFIRKLFAGCTVDEKGNGDPRLVTPRYALPLADYPAITEKDGTVYSRSKDRFYRCVPCEDTARRFLGDAFEDFIYCFTYKPYSVLSKNAEELHGFIERILKENRVGAREVVLIPMSMGATVTSAYLARYPEREKNHVRRVVSIVGCWHGSEAVSDLAARRFIRKPAALLADAAQGKKGPGGAALRTLLRLFSPRALDGMLDTALEAIVRELIFDASSLMALIPTSKYGALRSLAVSDAVRKDADDYQAARLTLNDRLRALSAQGVGFSFIAGYGLGFGEVSGGYGALNLLESAAAVNSDEIIHVESTVPGAISTLRGERFEDETGRRLSPDGSVDLSPALFPDSCWLFYGQKHELEHNDTALSLAILLALGKIKTVKDCDSPTAPCGYYPQFNGSRDTKDLKHRDLPRLQKYLAAGGALTADQQRLFDEVLAMRLHTVNDREKDEALMRRFAEMLDELGLTD